MILAAALHEHEVRLLTRRHGAAASIFFFFVDKSRGRRCCEEN